jgi:phage terminase small subunit
MNKSKSEIKSIKLTPKQEIFCYEYCIDFNATRAAIKAGYNKNSARQIASDNLTKVYIQDRIRYMRDNVAETAGISIMKIINEHAKIAFSSFANMKDGWMLLKDFEKLTETEKACISEIQTKESRRADGGDGIVIEEWVKLKLWDKQKSLDSISKLLGFDAPQKIDLTSKGEKLESKTFIQWGDQKIPI